LARISRRVETSGSSAISFVFFMSLSRISRRVETAHAEFLTRPAMILARISRRVETSVEDALVAVQHGGDPESQEALKQGLWQVDHVLLHAIAARISRRVETRYATSSLLRNLSVSPESQEGLKPLLNNRCLAGATITTQNLKKS